MNVAEAKNEKYILYMYQLFYKTFNTFRTVESLGPDMNHIIGYTAFHFKLYILQNNKVLKQNIKDSSVLSSGVGLSTFIL